MNYKKILRNFKNKNILIIGDLILDHYVEGKVDRISPEAPVPVVTVYKDDDYKLGGAGNVAHNIVSLGARASVAGIIGKDPRGKELLRLLKKELIKTDCIIQTNRRTTVKTRVIAHNHQQVVRVDREDNSPLKKKHFEDIKSFIKTKIKNFDAIIISDYKKGVITKELIQYINDLAGKRKMFVAVDPKVGHFECYHGVSLITPNKKEAGIMSHIEISDKASLIKSGETLLGELEINAVLITQGEEGMTLFEKGKKERPISTVAQDVYDVTGAGDTVISSLTLAHISGASLFEAATIANHAAGIVVGKAGTATATIKEILHSMSLRS